MKKKYFIINSIWLLIISLLVIIYLITIKFGANDELVKYLSFGLTITSLFVGLVAIFQSFFSSDSITRTIGLIDKSSNDVSKSTHDLNSLLSSFETKFELSNAESLKNADILKGLIVHLKDNFDRIPDSISELSKKIDAQKIDIPQRSDNINTKTQTELPEEFYKVFFNTSSVRSHLLFYAIRLSFEGKKPFKLIDLDLDGTGDDSYSSGIFIASNAAQIFKCSMTYPEDSGDISKAQCTINELSPYFIKYNEQLLKKIESVDSKAPWFASFKITKEKVENLFNT